jgi:hypothetical protein
MVRGTKGILSNTTCLGQLPDEAQVAHLRWPITCGIFAEIWCCSPDPCAENHKDCGRILLAAHVAPTGLAAQFILG